MNMLNLIPEELAQLIYKEYFKLILHQIRCKNCFRTFYTDVKCTSALKCGMKPVTYGAFCHFCYNGTIEYY